MTRFSELFLKPKPIIGMLHLAGGSNAIWRAEEEVKIFEDEGLDGAIVENYHGSIVDLIGAADRLGWKRPNLVLGMNILPNEFQLALPIASWTNEKFVQLDYIAGTYSTIDGTSELPVEEYQKIRAICHDVLVFGGVHPKYYMPLSDFKQDLITAMSRADAIVITGKGTGEETPLKKLKAARQVLGKFPMIVGAGLNPSNAYEQLSIADGAIVGSALKVGNRTDELVDRQKVRALMKVVEKVRNEVRLPE